MLFQEEYEKIKQQYYSKERQEQIEQLRERLKGRQVVLFGAAWIGDFVYERLGKMGITPVCFADNFAQGCTPKGYMPILRPRQVKENYPNCIVILSLDRAKQVVYEQLIELGFAQDQIISDIQLLITTMDIEEFTQHEKGYEWAYNFFSDEQSKRIIMQRIGCYLLGMDVDKSPYPQYFEKGLFELSDQEVFVDGGFFTGDTTEELIRQTKGRFRAVYGFEPDRFVREKVSKELLQDTRIQIIPKGLDAKEDTLFFATTGGHSAASGGNVVSKECNAENVISIPVTSIDFFFGNLPKEQQPTFIKMDIEGSEQQALRGAERTIRSYKPKLAICIYHKPEDTYVLTRQIRSYNPEYRFCLRHYAHYFWETVLYAY